MATNKRLPPKKKQWSLSNMNTIITYHFSFLCHPFATPSPPLRHHSTLSYFYQNLRFILHHLDIVLYKLCRLHCSTHQTTKTVLLLIHCGENKNRWSVFTYTQILIHASIFIQSLSQNTNLEEVSEMWYLAKLNKTWWIKTPMGKWNVVHSHSLSPNPVGVYSFIFCCWLLRHFFTLTPLIADSSQRILKFTMMSATDSIFDARQPTDIQSLAQPNLWTRAR